MEILAGLSLAAFALYAWLVGHWFGRVVAFLIPSLLWTGLAFLFWTEKGGPHGVTFVIWIMALGGTWIVSGLPQWYWQRREREFYKATTAARADTSLVRG